jgi:hypothetical protein
VTCRRKLSLLKFESNNNLLLEQVDVDFSDEADGGSEINTQQRNSCAAINL